MRSVSAVVTELALLLLLLLLLLFALLLLLLLAPSDSELAGLTPMGAGVSRRFTHAPVPVRSSPERLRVPVDVLEEHCHMTWTLRLWWPLACDVLLVLQLPSTRARE